MQRRGDRLDGVRERRVRVGERVAVADGRGEQVGAGAAERDGLLVVELGPLAPHRVRACRLPALVAGAAARTNERYKYDARSEVWSEVEQAGRGSCPQLWRSVAFGLVVRRGDGGTRLADGAMMLADGRADGRGG